MNCNCLSQLLLDQSIDLIWMVDSDFQLVFANKSYLDFVKEITGKEIKLNESIFTKDFGEEYIVKWKAYYKRAIQGEHFELEESFYHPITKEIKSSQITFKPIFDDNKHINAVACQSRNITHAVKERSKANQLMDASLDIFCSIDEKGNFIYVSAAAKSQWGYHPSELIGKSYLKLTLKEDIPKTYKIAKSIIEGKETRSFLNRFNKKDGSIAYNSWSAKWDDQAKAIYCVVRESREKFEEKKILYQSEQRFKALVQGGSDLIAILDNEFNYLYVGPTSTSVLGVEPEYFIGKNALSFIHPEDVERILGSLQKITTQISLKLEPFRFLNRHNEWRWIETVLTNMLNNNTVKGIVANSRDITDTIQEEQKLKLLEKVINSTTDAIIISDADFFDEPGPKILYVNGAFTKMTGYAPEEVLGKSPRFLQGSNSNQKELRLLGEKLRRGESAEATVLNYNKQGEAYWVNLTVSPVANHTGSFTHWISIQRNVTEQINHLAEQDLIANISLIFKEEVELVAASKRLCNYLIAFNHFDLVELWLPNMEHNKINLFAYGVTNESFYSHNISSKSFLLGKGLPGQVWQSKKQILWKENEIDEYFVRKESANRLDLKAVLGVPMLYQDEIKGVLMLGTSQSPLSLTKFCKIIHRLESFIGSEINRKLLENNLEKLYDSITDILCISDLNGKFLRINKAACDLLGYPSDEILFHYCEEFIHPADIETYLYHSNQLRNKNITVRFENRLLTKEGKIIWLSWNCTSNLELGLMYASAKNITEEKKLFSLNRQASRMAKIGSWEVDLESSNIFWSEMTHQIHETDVISFNPNLKNAINFYREDFRDMVASTINESILEGADFDFEAVIVTKYFKEKWVRAIGTTETLDGVSKRIIGSLQDITDRKEAEIRLQYLADNLPGVVFQYYLYTNGTDALKYVSKGSLKVWGLKSEDVIDNITLVWNQISAGGQLDEVRKTIADSVATKTKWTARWKYVMPSGEVKTHLGFGSPLFLVDGTVIFNSVILDITQEIKNEELLEEVSKISKIGSWENDLIHGNHFKSSMVNEILEIESDQFISNIDNAISFCREDFQSTLKAKFSNCLKKGKSFDIEAVILTAKKNEKWVRILANPVMYEGKCIKIYGSIQDIQISKALELQIREILSSISDAFYAVDEKWNLTYFNKEAERLLLKKETDVIGENIWRLFPETERTSLEVHYRQVVDSKKAATFEYLHPMEGHWYEVSVYPSGKGLAVYFKNINDRKTAAEFLRNAYEEKNNILESIGDAFFTLSREWIVTYWNQKAEYFLGVSRDNILGKGLWEVFSDAVDTDFHRQYHYAMETRETVRFEEKYEKLGKWFEVAAYPSGEGLSIYFTDITLRKETDERLLQANERFEKATQATNDAIWDWDIQSNTFYRSSGIDKFFGKEVPKKLAEKQFWEEMFHPEDLPDIQKSLNKALKDPTCDRWEVEYRLINYYGSIIYVLERGLIIRNSNGVATRMVGAMSDITDRINLQLELKELNQSLQIHARELERSNEELEQFAFIASHDLQEPLRMISSFMDLLRKKYEDKLDAKALQYIDFASDGAKRMKQIILDLLDFSRANRPTEDIQEVDINEVLSDFKQLRRKILSETSSSINSDKLPIIKTYKTVITQIIHSLLDNAIKYNDTAPIINIQVKEKDNEWEFSITDNGIGIDPRFFDKIFVLFQRLHNKEKYNGTGIGLSIVKRSVEFLGGRIWLNSELQKGTTFFFTLSKTE